MRLRTAWEALTRMRVDGRDRLLITGLGPVGLAAAMLGRALGARHVIGVDTSNARCGLALELGLVDDALPGDGETLARIECSGAPPAREVALAGTRRWGRCAFVGEGGDVQFEVSPLLIHTRSPSLVPGLPRCSIWPNSPSALRAGPCTRKRRSRIADGGQSGKVVITMT